jgi:hypothetical protein
LACAKNDQIALACIFESFARLLAGKSAAAEGELETIRRRHSLAEANAHQRTCQTKIHKSEPKLSNAL